MYYSEQHAPQTTRSLLFYIMRLEMLPSHNNKVFATVPDPHSHIWQFALHVEQNVSTTQLKQDTWHSPQLRSEFTEKASSSRVQVSHDAIFTKSCCEAEDLDGGPAAEADEPRCNLFALQKYQIMSFKTSVFRQILCYQFGNGDIASEIWIFAAEFLCGRRTREWFDENFSAVAHCWVIPIPAAYVIQITKWTAKRSLYHQARKLVANAHDTCNLNKTLLWRTTECSRNVTHNDCNVKNQWNSWICLPLRTQRTAETRQQWAQENSFMHTNQGAVWT